MFLWSSFTGQIYLLSTLAMQSLSSVQPAKPLVWIWSTPIRYKAGRRESNSELSSCLLLFSLLSFPQVLFFHASSVSYWSLAKACAGVGRGYGVQYVGRWATGWEGFSIFHLCVLSFSLRIRPQLRMRIVDPEWKKWGCCLHIYLNLRKPLSCTHSPPISFSKLGLFFSLLSCSIWLLGLVPYCLFSIFVH